MKENAIQKRCILWARQKQAGRILVVNIHGDGYTNKGFPDLLVFGHGRVIAVELKSDTSGYQLQPDQEIWRDRLEAVGIEHYICRSFEDFKNIVKIEFGF